MYPSEFPGAAYDPVDAPVFFSLSPALLALILLLMLLALACGWFGRERFGPRPRDPSQGVYDAIRKAAEDALKASRDDVHARARRLVDTVERRLGGVIALSDGLCGPWRDIRAVLDPEPKIQPDAPCGDQGKAPQKNGSELMVINTGKMVFHAGGEAGKGGHDSPDSAGKDHPGDAQDPGHHHKSGGHGGESDRRDEVARLRAALHAFADHWRDKPRRLAELRRARADLC